MSKQKKTMHEKWESASKEPGNGLHFHDTPDTGKRIPLEGFTDEELKRIMGDEEFKKMKKNIEEIEEL